MWSPLECSVDLQRTSGPSQSLLILNLGRLSFGGRGAYSSMPISYLIRAIAQTGMRHDNFRLALSRAIKSVSWLWLAAQVTVIRYLTLVSRMNLQSFQQSSRRIHGKKWKGDRSSQASFHFLGPADPLGASACLCCLCACVRPGLFPICCRESRCDPHLRLQRHSEVQK